MTMLAGQKEEIHRLWDDLSDFATSQSQEAVLSLMAALVKLAGVANATWAGAIRMSGGDERDPLQGWRVATFMTLAPLALQSDEGHLGGVLRLWDRREIDPSFLLPLKEVGTFRTYSLRRGLPAEWFETPFYHRHYGFCGVHDVVFVAFPLNEDCESHFGFYAHQPVSDETIALLTYAVRGIKWFHRHLMLSHGLLMASAPLTPTEHKVLQLLLTEMTEKRIARELVLGESATHRHVVAIFRKFGVRSRAGLISLWLNHPAGLDVGIPGAPGRPD